MLRPPPEHFEPGVEAGAHHGANKSNYSAEGTFPLIDFLAIIHPVETQARQPSYVGA